jgi:hypothetical protein
MGESVPGADPATAGRGHWRLRVPPSIMVTIVVAAFTAWVAPALTRQWDDRQKAHELKASLVAEMASASGQALVAGADAVRVGQTAGFRSGEGERAWAVASFKIALELRAYFRPSVFNAWDRYRTLVAFALAASYHRQKIGDVPPWRAGDPPVYRPTAQVVEYLQAAVDRRDGRFKAYGVRSPPVKAWDVLLGGFGAVQREAAAAVLNGKPSGYSTTFSDFLRDLVP